MTILFYRITAYHTQHHTAATRKSSNLTMTCSVDPIIVPTLPPGQPLQWFRSGVLAHWGTGYNRPQLEIKLISPEAYRQASDRGGRRHWSKKVKI